jgi:hypothetical protein
MLQVPERPTFEIIDDDNDDLPLGGYMIENKFDFCIPIV